MGTLGTTDDCHKVITNPRWRFSETLQQSTSHISTWKCIKMRKIMREKTINSIFVPHVCQMYIQQFIYVFSIISDLANSRKAHKPYVSENYSLTQRSFFPGCPEKCKEADISFVLNFSQSFWTFHPFSQLYAVLQLYTVFLSDLGLSVFLFLDILITTLSLSFLSFRLCVSHLLSLAYRIFVISFTQVGSHSLY